MCVCVCLNSSPAHAEDFPVINILLMGANPWLLLPACYSFFSYRNSAQFYDASDNPEISCQ